MSYEDWITQQFFLYHEALIDGWQSEKSFGTKKHWRVAEQMKDYVQATGKLKIEQIENPFLRRALETALNEIKWSEFADHYFETLEMSDPKKPLKPLN